MIKGGGLEDGAADSTQIKGQLVQRGCKGTVAAGPPGHRGCGRIASPHDGKERKRLGENITSSEGHRARHQPLLSCGCHCSL